MVHQEMDRPRLGGREEMMKLYRVKFFGSKDRKKQIQQVRIIVSADSYDRVADILRHRFGYEVINGLKIRECGDDEEK